MEPVLDGFDEEVGVVVVELEEGLELLHAPLDVARPAAQKRFPEVRNSFRKTHFSKKNLSLKQTCWKRRFEQNRIKRYLISSTFLGQVQLITICYLLFSRFAQARGPTWDPLGFRFFSLSKAVP